MAHILTRLLAHQGAPQGARGSASTLHGQGKFRLKALGFTGSPKVGIMAQNTLKFSPKGHCSTHFWGSVRAAGVGCGV